MDCYWDGPNFLIFVWYFAGGGGDQRLVIYFFAEKLQGLYLTDIYAVRVMGVSWSKKKNKKNRKKVRKILEIWNFALSLHSQSDRKACKFKT